MYSYDDTVRAVDLFDLAAPVEQAMGLGPFAAAVYLFHNRRAHHIKIVGWDRNGLWVLFKRLEQDWFAWSRHATVATLSVEQLH